MSIISTDLTRAILADDARSSVRAVREREQPCTHVAPGVPALVYAAFMQRGDALDALLSAGLDVDARYEHPPFDGWRAFHFASADRDPEATQKLVAAGCDTTSPAPNALVGTAWLDAIEGLSINAFTSYVTACKATTNSLEFLNHRDPAGRTAIHVAAILGSAPLSGSASSTRCSSSSGSV